MTAPRGTRDVEKWLNDMFEEADAMSDRTDFDPGTNFYGVVTRHIPTVALAVPARVDPRMHPERIPKFYMWVRAFVVEGKIND